MDLASYHDDKVLQDDIDNVLKPTVVNISLEEHDKQMQIKMLYFRHFQYWIVCKEKLQFNQNKRFSKSYCKIEIK